MSLLLQDWPRAQAERRPRATALVCDSERVTYEELERASNRLARGLRAIGCRAQDRVVLLLPKSPDAIVAALATLKLRGIYVPIDAASPVARVERILRSAEPRAILASRETAALLEGLGRRTDGPAGAAAIGWMGHEKPSLNGVSVAFDRSDLDAEDSEPLPHAGHPSEPAHMLFTSGSTGVPKGVVIKHENVIPFVEWAVQYFGIAESDRLSNHSPLHFDLSTFDIYGAFAAGAELHLVPGRLNLLPHKLAEFIREAGLTQWFSVPSILSYLARSELPRPNDFRASRP